MEEMAELRHEVGDVQDTLETLHRDPNNSAIGMFSSYSHGFFLRVYTLAYLKHM